MSQVMTAAPAWTIPGFLEARENNHLFISGADATALTVLGSALSLLNDPEAAELTIRRALAA